MPIGSRIPGLPSGPSVAPRLIAGHDTGLGFIPVAEASDAQKVIADANGQAIARFQAQQDQVWHVQRISVSTNSASVTTATVYLGDIDPANIVDVTPNGNLDIADEMNAILVPSAQSLLVVWTGATVGAECSVRVQWVAGRVEQLPTQSFGR